jgi:hypothetical protein
MLWAETVVNFATSLKFSGIRVADILRPCFWVKVEFANGMKQWLFTGYHTYFKAIDTPTKTRVSLWGNVTRQDEDDLHYTKHLYAQLVNIGIWNMNGGPFYDIPALLDFSGSVTFSFRSEEILAFMR